MKKKIILIIVLLIALLLCIKNIPETIEGNIIAANNIVVNEQVVENEVIANVIVTDEAQEIVNETTEATLNDEVLDTIEVIYEDVNEDEIENDAQVDVDEDQVQYNGDITGEGLSLLGAYQGDTYYSQADSRWANVMYSSVGNTSQTMKTSACGPTSAAMVVSSCKGAILPTTMAQLSVANGFRTANNGTAWSFFTFVADYFDFKEFYSTSNFNTMVNYLSQKNANGTSKYYAVASCTTGLWTTSGHYICIAGIDGDTVKVYDPYIYNGKFNTASRRAANVTVSGNTAYVSKANFAKYSSAKNYWIFSNDEGIGTTVTKYKAGERCLIDIPVAICCYSGDYVLVDSNGYQFWIHKSVINSQNHIYALADICFNQNDGLYICQIFSNQFWCKECYMFDLPKIEEVKTTTTATAETKTTSTVGQTKSLKTKTNMYSKSNLTGTTYTYKAGTKVRILKNISNTIDYIQVISTGRKAYIRVSSYK